MLESQRYGPGTQSRETETISEGSAHVRYRCRVPEQLGVLLLLLFKFAANAGSSMMDTLYFRACSIIFQTNSNGAFVQLIVSSPRPRNCSTSSEMVLCIDTLYRSASGVPGDSLTPRGPGPASRDPYGAPLAGIGQMMLISL